MKIDKKIFSIFLVIVSLFLLVFDQSAYAARRYLVGTGNFNNTAIWSTTSGGSGGASVPGAGDWVIVDNNFTVTLNVNATIDSLTISNGTFDASTFFLTVLNTTDVSGGLLTLGSGFRTFVDSLTLSGSGTLNCGSSNMTLRSDFSISGGTFSAGTSTLRFNASGGAVQTLRSTINITLNNITIDQAFPDNINAGVVFSTTAPFVIFTINGTFELRYPDQLGITTAGFVVLIYSPTSTLKYAGQNFAGSSSQLTGAEFLLQVNNLEINVGSYPNGVDLTGEGDKQVQRNLTLTQGILTQGATENIFVGGNVVTGTLTTSGFYVGGTIVMRQNQPQFIEAGGGSIANLTINKTNTTDVVRLNTQILNITGNLNIQNGIFELGPGSNGINLSGSSSVFRIQAGGTFRTGGKQVSNAGTFNLETGSTFEFTGTSQEQTPTGISFSNLRMSNPGGLNVIGNILVNGNLVFNADNNVVVSGGVNTLTIGSSGSISGANSNRFILGPLRKQYTGTGSFTYPIGVEELSTFYYRPATFNYTAGTFGGTSVIRVAYTRASFSPNPLPPGISALDPSGHYQVTELGTAPSSFTYSFTGTFDEGNFPLESRNRALVETASSYTIASTNSVDEVNNTVTSGDFSALPVGSNFIVFGSGGTSVTWDGGAGDGLWSSANNWDPNTVPISTDDVTIDLAVTVDITATTAAVAQTLTLGGTNNPVLVVGGTAGNPLRIYQTSGTPLTVNNASILRIINSQGIKFDPDNTNLYDPARTNYSGTSTVEYQAGIVQADEYQNLLVNGAASSSSSGSIVVSTNFEKQSVTGFTASIPVTVSGTYVNTEGTATFTGGLTMNGTDFNVNNGSIGGSVTFSGSGSQNIGGAANPAIFSSLSLNNSNGLVLNTPVQINTSLNLSAGLITTTSNLLTLVGSATATGNDNSYVYGPLARTLATGTKEYPIGKSSYRPVSTNLSGSTPTVQFEVFDTRPTQNWLDPLVLISQVRYWLGNINSGSVSSGSVTLNYGDDDGVQLGDSLRVAYSPDQSSTAYVSIGGSGSSAGAGSITGTLPSNALGYFTLGSVSFDNPLPVDLAIFTAVGESGKILLKWETASEVNNLGFDIYRSESESGTYQRINQQIIQGRGNSNTSNHYEYVDVEVMENMTYFYKLYSRDFDGTIHDYGKIASALVKPLPTTFAVAQNYPNPFNPSTRISFDVAKESAITLEVYNMLGQKMRTLIDNQRYLPGVYNDIIWNARDDQGNSVANGIYYLVFSAKDYGYQQVRKMVFMK